MIPQSVLDLSPEGVRRYWLERAPSLAHLFAEVGKVEPWTLDHEPDIRDRLIRFGNTLSTTPGAAQRLEFARHSDLLHLLVFIDRAKAFLLLHWLDEHHDGLGSRLVMTLVDAAEQMPGQEVLHQTLVDGLRMLNNGPFFRELFDPKRVNGLVRAITNYQSGGRYA